MDLYLSDDELQELTGRVRYSAQARALEAMGISHTVRPLDGRPMVLSSALEPERPIKPRGLVIPPRRRRVTDD